MGTCGQRGLYGEQEFDHVEFQIVLVPVVRKMDGALRRAVIFKLAQ